jgi:two-component system nitrate/nitrite response regulator NarL
LRLVDPDARRRVDPIRIFLVEDQSLVRRAFRGVLEHESDLLVVGETSTAEQALQEIPEARPDVILIDLGLPGISGLEATRRLRAMGCPARLVVLSASEDFEDVVSSLQAGAHGYMHKRIHAEELVDSVRRASQGEPVIPRDMVAAYLEHQARERRTSIPLSEREQQVLLHLASGASNREIASLLHSAEGTVKTHVRNVYRKLGIGTRKQAAACARTLGLIG